MKSGLDPSADRSVGTGSSSAAVFAGSIVGLNETTADACHSPTRPPPSSGTTPNLNSSRVASAILARSRALYGAGGGLSERHIQLDDAHRLRVADGLRTH